MNLSSPSSDLRELQKQNDLFLKLKLEHDRQLKELTKGQDVHQMEVRAKKTLEDAKVEAANIVATAKRGVEQVSRSKSEYESLKAKVEEAKAVADTAKADALKTKSEADRAKAEAEDIKSKLEKECLECDKLKTDLKAKVKELQEILVRFNGSLN